MEVRQARTNDELSAALDLRERVFCDRRESDLVDDMQRYLS